MKAPLLLLVTFAASLWADTPFTYWPGVEYDPAVPAQKSVLGREPGERISSPAEILRYMEALAAAAPTRMKLFDYGKTWEGPAVDLYGDRVRGEHLKHRHARS